MVTIDVAQESLTPVVRIIVIGVGGAGNNAIGRMIEEGIQGVELIGVNTDKQALLGSKAANTIQIGEKTTGGRGAGAKPEVGEKSAEESAEEISAAIKGADMVFVTCGMGGGTGTGAAPVIARIAKEQGILTVGIVSKPFKYEGKRRMDNALEGIARLRENVDSLVVIPNERLFEVVNKTEKTINAFKLADQTLHQAVSGITDLIIKSALINLDFADVETVMKDKGLCHIGIGTASGDQRATEAVKAAIENPLLETSIQGASDLLVNITGDVDMNDLYTINSYITDITGEDVNIISGLTVDPEMGDAISVSIIATGLEEPSAFGANIGGPVYKPSAPVTAGFNPVVKPQPAAPVTPVNPVTGYTAPVYTQPSYVSPAASTPVSTSTADILSQAATTPVTPTASTVNVPGNLPGLNTASLDTAKGEVQVNIPDFLARRK